MIIKQGYYMCDDFQFVLIRQVTDILTENYNFIKVVNPEKALNHCWQTFSSLLNYI